LRARLSYSQSPTRQPVFQVRGETGLYGGRTSATVEIVWDDRWAADWQTRIVGDDVELAQLLARFRPSSAPAAGGRVSGFVEMKQTGPGTGGIEGTGAVRARGLRVANSPVLAEVGRVVRFGAPTDRIVFDTASSTFRLRGDIVALPDLRLENRYLRIEGQGQVRLDQTADLTLTATVPGNAVERARAPVADMLARTVGAMADPFVEIVGHPLRFAVTGPLSRPVVTSAPFARPSAEFGATAGAAFLDAFSTSTAELRTIRTPDVQPPE
jgi:hypothetical protein